MTPVRSLPARVSLAACGVVLAAAVLSGCSVAGTDFHPGVAATVGDTVISGNEVDRLTTDACTAFGSQLKQDNQVVPLRYIKSTVAQNLALASAVRQMGREFGVTPSDQYTREVTSTTANAGDLSAGELDAVLLVSSTTSLVSDILGQVGVQLSEKAPGAEAAAPLSPASDEAVQAGGAELTRWLRENDVTLDPLFGVQLTDTGSVAVDTSLSFPISAAALAAQSAEPDQAATMALPSTQRCGDYSGGAPAGGAGAG